jgi:membrane protease YdiL (CAAX protease family)
LGPLPHPPFPTSLAASIVAGIGEEIIFRLFFIPFWLWLVSIWLLKGRWQQPIFWTVAILSALAFAFGHLPSVMVLMGFESVQAIPPALLIEMVILNGVLSLFAAYYLKVYGFLAAAGVHFWTDVIWHVLWGGLS